MFEGTMEFSAGPEGGDVAGVNGWRAGSPEPRTGSGQEVIGSTVCESHIGVIEGRVLRRAAAASARRLRLTSLPFS